jgi:hypothetical protein
MRMPTIFKKIVMQRRQVSRDGIVNSIDVNQWSQPNIR